MEPWANPNPVGTQISPRAAHPILKWAHSGLVRKVPPMHRTVALLLAAGLALAGCSRSDGGGSTNTTSEPAPGATASSAPAPSTTVAPTTSLPTAVTVTTAIEGADGAMAAAIAAVYTAALNPEQDAEGVPAGLLSQFKERAPQPGPVTIAGSVTTGRILDTDIAVFTSGHDVVLLAGAPGVDSGSATGWEVAGAKLASLDEPAWYGNAPRLVLVLGSDARPGQKVTGFRADSVHVVASVPATGEGSVVGIPRDSWVEASYGRQAKLTNTMASRGPEVVLETVRLLTGLELEGYLVTGFQGFEGLIDAFGGFSITVPYGMADPKSNAYFNAGVQQFDGADALAFSRNRTDTPRGDFGRQLNHGLVMLAMLPEVQERGVAQLPQLLEILTRFVITDLDASDLLAIAASSFELDPEKVSNVVAPGRAGSTSGGASVVFLGDEAFELFDDVADGVVDGTY